MYIKGLKGWISNLVVGIYQILNKTNFYYASLLIIFFVWFNADFLVTTAQAIKINDITLKLTLLNLAVIFYAFMYNPKGLKNQLNRSRGILPFVAFFFTVMIVGVILQSMEGRLNTDLIYGLLLVPSYLAFKEYVIAFSEECIFRLGLQELFKTKTTNKAAVYILSSAFFSIFHGFVYGWNPLGLFYAFIAGLFFTWIKEQEDISGFPTFAISVALHFVINNFVNGSLHIVLTILPTL